MPSREQPAQSSSPQEARQEPPLAQNRPLLFSMPHGQMAVASAEVLVSAEPSLW